MPTQARGFFSCDFCGLVCDTLEEASEHEFQCTKRPQQAHLPPPQGPPGAHPYPPRGPPYAATGPMAVPEMETYGQPPPHAHPAHAPQPVLQKLRAVPLLGPNEQNPELAPDDIVACQNVELFEASPEHAADMDASRTGGLPVVVRQVGVRCLHCNKSAVSPVPYSTTFPTSLGSIAINVRGIADNHLVACRLAPPQVRAVCEGAAKKRQEAARTQGAAPNQEEERSRMAFLDYCVGFCQQMGIVNRQPHKTGISFSDVDLPPGQTALPPTPAETPAPNRGPGAPFDRMGPPMSYDRRTAFPTPGGPMGFQGMSGMMGGPLGPGDAIAPTPLQRRRPGPEGPARGPPVFSGDRAEAGPMSAGYPTPFSQPAASVPPGYGQDVATPAQPNFEGKEGAYPTPRSVPPSAQSAEASPGFSQYDLPANFPFYQESDRSWHCKFCSHVHPSYRDPQAIWSAPNGSPPPGGFIDAHLSICRGYHQSMPSPPVYQGPPPPYGTPPFVTGYPPHPPPGWDGHPGAMHPQHMSYPPPGPGHPNEPPFPYPPQHMEPPPRGYPRPEEMMGYGDPQNRLGPPGAPPGAVPPRGPVPGPRPVAPARAENIGDAMRRSVSHLLARENEYLARDPAAKVERLVLDEDKLLLTEYFYHLMKQLRLCRFSEADRKTRGGKREKIKLGYGGLQCIHCADVPNSRKFYWSNVDRLANSFAEIPGHILKCRRCPQQTKDALVQLKQFHPEQMARLPRGSQKVFFRRMWRRLHDEDSQEMPATPTDKSNSENVAPLSTPAKAVSPEKKDATESKSGKESPAPMRRSTKEAAKILADSVRPEASEAPAVHVMLAIPEDKEWLSDMDCFIRKQLEVFCATEKDIEIAKADRKYPVHLGQIGIRCIHCSASTKGARGTAVAHPFAISGIYESVREFQRLHLDSCENLPADTKSRLSTFKGSSSLSSVLRKYYILAAGALGLHDTREGIRAGGEAVPLDSQAAFNFAETGVPQVTSFRDKGSVALSAPDASIKASPPTSDKKRDASDAKVDDEPPAKKAKADSPSTAVSTSDVPKSESPMKSESSKEVKGSASEEKAEVVDKAPEPAAKTATATEQEEGTEKDASDKAPSQTPTEPKDDADKLTSDTTKEAPTGEEGSGSQGESVEKTSDVAGEKEVEKDTEKDNNGEAGSGEAKS